MKIIILGANGMIGYGLFDYLSKYHDVIGTLRRDKNFYKNITQLYEKNIIYGVDVKNISEIKNILISHRPDILVNATGIVKQITGQVSEADIIELNALVPHKLCQLTRSESIKLIQFSTDCVFSGKKGNYSEDDTPDPIDFYGLSKYMGEVNQKGVLTLRTSTIGLELTGSHGLIEWFLKQTGGIDGYMNAIYTGITINELAKFVNFLITKHRDIDGLWQVAGTQINKFALLSILGAKLQRKDIQILPNKEYVCDRSLVNTKIVMKTDYKFPDWEIMLEHLAQEINNRESSK